MEKHTVNQVIVVGKSIRILETATELYKKTINLIEILRIKYVI